MFYDAGLVDEYFSDRDIHLAFAMSAHVPSDYLSQE